MLQMFVYRFFSHPAGAGMQTSYPRLNSLN